MYNWDFWSFRETITRECPEGENITFKIKVILYEAKIERIQKASFNYLGKVNVIFTRSLGKFRSLYFQKPFLPIK